ncbi:MAG: hypothetical protein EAX95_04790 [Candidatus Thorarchaeota archaeon]|nr:hypothetical protein [Candidatus Thorarchaeota archaeon]
MAIAILIVNWTLELVIPLVPEATSISIIRPLPGNIRADVLWLLTYIVPIMFVEFLVLVIPGAFILILVAKLLRFRKYDLSIIELGEEFGATLMIRRAVVPALFSLAIGQLVFQLIQGILFDAPPVSALPEVALRFYLPLMSMVSTLIVLPISLIYFMPTWVLNDAGVVSHLKVEQLKQRRCPDTIGLGRWYSNFLGGFSLLAVPITSIVQNFVTPLQILFNNTPNPTFEMLLQVIIRGSFYSLGLPFLAVAFVIPVVLLNEIIGAGMKRTIRGLARKMGAKDVLSDILVLEVDPATDSTVTSFKSSESDS